MAIRHWRVGSREATRTFGKTNPKLGGRPRLPLISPDGPEWCAGTAGTRSPRKKGPDGLRPLADRVEICADCCIRRFDEYPYEDSYQESIARCTICDRDKGKFLFPAWNLRRPRWHLACRACLDPSDTKWTRVYAWDIQDFEWAVGTILRESLIQKRK